MEMKSWDYFCIFSIIAGVCFIMGITNLTSAVGLIFLPVSAYLSWKAYLMWNKNKIEEQDEKKPPSLNH